MKIQQIKKSKQLRLNQCEPYRVYNDHLNWFLLQVIKSKNKSIKEFDMVMRQGCKSISDKGVRR